ncbi:MAG: PaaX family transcriptional regulator [Nocardioidaceae bacterium]
MFVAADSGSVNARSALFDVYGDHLRSRGGMAPVAALVRMLGPLEVAAPAVRTAISRMVRQRWLRPVKLDGGPGYALTPQAERRLTEAASRIYRSDLSEWDHHWHLLVVDHVLERAARRRIRSALSYLGYAPLRDDVWISPRPSAEVDGLLGSEGVRARRFRSRHDGNDDSLAAAAWDLEGLGRAYTRWLNDAHELVGTTSEEPSDVDAFVIRSTLVHEWRKFLFTDPGLPRDLLPVSWPGDEAAQFFDTQTARLLAGAGRYVDQCLAGDSAEQARVERTMSR